LPSFCQGVQTVPASPSVVEIDCYVFDARLRGSDRL